MPGSSWEVFGVTTGRGLASCPGWRRGAVHDVGRAGVLVQCGEDLILSGSAERREEADGVFGVFAPWEIHYPTQYK